MPTCSDDSALHGEQLAGSAPTALAWLALEQRGPWGARAFTDSHLDRDLGATIEAAAAAHRTRPVLIRRPGRHPDRSTTLTDPRRLLVAFTHPDDTWLLEGTIDRPEDVLGLDWAALEAGDRAAVRRSLPSLAASDTAHLLVCTNGSRDVCCAVKGRPLALRLADDYPDRIWEVTHTSGHRFAPTAVLLPSGTLHGRLDEARAKDVLTAAARAETVLDGNRGRSTWAAAAQVAELAVRDRTGETSLDALTVTAHEDLGEHAWTTLVQHRDGRSWRVGTMSEATDTQRAESCGKTLKGLRRYTTTVAALAGQARTGDPAQAGPDVR